MDDDDDHFWNFSSTVMDPLGEPLFPLPMEELLHPPLPVDDLLQPPLPSSLSHQQPHHQQPPMPLSTHHQQPLLPLSSHHQQPPMPLSTHHQQPPMPLSSHHQQPFIGELQMDGADQGADDTDGQNTELEDGQNLEPEDQQDTDTEDMEDDDVSGLESSSVRMPESDVLVGGQEEEEEEETEPPEKKFRPIGHDFSDYGLPSRTLENIASSSQGSGSTSHTSLPSNEFYNMSVSFNSNGHYDNIISEFGNDIDDDETVIMSKTEQSSDDTSSTDDDELGNKEGDVDEDSDGSFHEEEFTLDVPCDDIETTFVKQESHCSYQKDFPLETPPHENEENFIEEDKLEQDFTQDCLPDEEGTVKADTDIQNSFQTDFSQDFIPGEDEKVEIEEIDQEDINKEDGDGDHVDEDTGADVGDADEEWEYDSDEIDAMLDEDLPQDVRVPKRKRGDDDSQQREGEKQQEELPDGVVAVRYKTILKGAKPGPSPNNLLPNQWIALNHEVGMQLYLHRPSRVVTWSRPYLLGKGSGRRHKVPISSIPCLHYKIEKERKAKAAAVNEQDVNPVQSNNQECQPSANKEQTDSRTSNELNSKNAEDNKKMTSIDNKGDTRGETSTSQSKDESIGKEEFKEYLTKVFEFEDIAIKKFKTWGEKRKHFRDIKKGPPQIDRPEIPTGPTLITCKIPDKHSGTKGQELVINAQNKSALVILHEYAQRVMKQSPSYTYVTSNNANLPFEACVVIGEHKYGRGQARSKKAAKLEAAQATLKVLIPDLAKLIKQPGKKEQANDLEYFDHVPIDDFRVYELCERSGLLSPWQLLHEYHQRNHGMTNMELAFNVKINKGQKSEYTITYGPHEATGVCKNKRVGKQDAAQKILVKLHPHLTTWGALIKLYGRRGIASQIQEKKELRKEVIDLQRKGSYKPNDRVLDKLKSEMRRLYLKHDKEKDATEQMDQDATTETTEQPQDVETIDSPQSAATCSHAR